VNKATTGALGLLAGALIGYLMRPSAPLIGQLSFGTVMTRGGNLQGLDQMLLPMAQSSFNHVLAGALLGALAGVVIGHLAASRAKVGPGG
jgi:hypothetical protein